MGQIIEKVTGQTLGAYMQQHIFDPLGIHSTTFELNAEQAARHTHIHMRASDKHLIETDPVNVYGGKVEIHTGGGIIVIFFLYIELNNF
jgi:CubicO group peptidase (beta-lactamase class C family)